MRKRKRLLTLLALLTAAAGAWAQATATTSATRTGSDNTYKVKMKEGTKDAAKWTIASDGNSTTGDKTEGLTVAPEKEVTLTYSGRLKVKSVTATHDGWNGDLSNIPASLIGSDGHTVIVPDGTTLTGTLDGETHPYKIVIPAGAKVTLADATINGVHNLSYEWAGINCEDGATIILADNTTNVVKGFSWDYPGIHVPEGKTLTIMGGSLGTGSLTASSNHYGCGIGGGSKLACGNIIIQGGDITATGSYGSAGIGSGKESGCGNITISGGTVTANGGYSAAGIGSGYESGCGNITISGGTVLATGGDYAAGIGSGYESGCGNITISGGTVLATGGDYAAGIGSGSVSGCGNITISGGTVTATGGIDATAIGCGGDESCCCGDITFTTGVTLIKATKSYRSYYCIGKEYSHNTCGTIRIGCTLDTDGNPNDDGTVYSSNDDYLEKSPFFYPYVDLSMLTGDYVATDGEVLKGTLDGTTQKYKITIADGATVTLADVIVKASGDESTKWAGIICAGDATIIVKDGTYNDVYAMYEGYPAIYIPGDANNSSNNKTLTIKGGTAGTGQLRANGGGGAAGIGGGKEIDCGNIIIEGGKIIANGTANGGASIGAGRAASCGNITITGGEIHASECNYTAGIGSGYDHSTCGKIIISGGTVYAIGGEYAAAIGSGYDVSKCGDILITTGVTKVTVSKPFDNTVYSIGPGNNSTCGTVWIGCTLDTDGNPVGGSKGFKTDSSFIYPPSN